MIDRTLWWSVFLLGLAFPLATRAQTVKQHSAFYPPGLMEQAKANARKYPWAARIAERVIEAAQPWMKLSDDQLWELMFGCTITRSHHVWSSGFCPSCQRPVPMYDWEIEAFERPWKVRCPRCRELFPKNDFYKYYRSGLDEQGVFDPRRADRALLFNTEHPEAQDPLHGFGVDDGEGYVEGGNRWRFIGAYLLYGQWWQLVEGGIARLAAAYAVSGEPVYAHKAAVLLDRVADLFPTFDYGAQGLVYERARYGGGVAGYVSYAIDSAYDVRRLALAYDQIFEAVRDDQGLVRFLSRKASRKTSFAEIQRNIEDRILREVLAHPEKIRTNYPGTEGAITMIKTVLGWPENRAEVLAAIDEIVAASTAVDGLSGEKGLAGYAAIAPRYLGEFIEHYARADAGLLPGLIERHPKFRQTYRFFVDTWCGREYYPNSGDAGTFAAKNPQYAGVLFRRGEAGGKMETDPPVSMYTFLWRFYKATGDPVYLQIARLGNGNSVEGLPFDLFAEDPEGLVKDVERVTAQEGPWPRVGSVNKQEWRLAILRSPQNPDAGAVWLDYDSIPNSKLKSHYHFDAMNLGLYAKGLDLLPEFGYPAVQFGDWHTPQARWHGMTAAHNTVVVDGKNQAGGEGKTTLWGDGQQFRVIRASSPEQIRGRQYERTVAMVDTSGADFYVLDVFRVAGGTDHAKFTHSHFGELSPTGLSLGPAPDYGHDTLMRRFRVDPQPAPGWSVDWKVEDRLGYLPPGSEVHLRYTDLTAGAQAYTCESWTVRSPTSTEEFWIPTVMTRHQAKEGPLASTFVSVLEPYEKTARLTRIRRLPLETPQGAACGDSSVAVEIQLASGASDLFIAADAGDPLAAAVVQKESGVRLSGEMALIRKSAAGKVESIAVCEGEFVSAGEIVLRLKKKTGFVEVAFENRRARVRSGEPQDVQEILIRGKPVEWR
jgi:hypothetical protein